MSSSFVNSQLFSNNLKKESYIKTNFHSYGYYSSVLDGKLTYTEWMELSPKERELALESQEEIRKIQNEVIKNMKNKDPKEKNNI